MRQQPVDVDLLLAKARGFVCGLPVVRHLPARGWPGLVVFLINPPKWFVVASCVTMAAVGIPLLLRLLWGSTFGVAEDVSKLILGLGGLLGAPFLVWRIWIADQQKKTGQEVHYTSLLTNAVEQLGATREGTPKPGSMAIPNVEHRIGAIYALEKLAHDYEQLHWPIMEILCAYVRENAGEPKVIPDEIRAMYVQKALGPRGDSKEWKERAAALTPPSADVQAALNVIGRRKDKQRDWEQKTIELAKSSGQREFCLDLTQCHLARANLDVLHFERADFRGSCMEQASLIEAYFESACLAGTHLEGATLTKAHLKCATLKETHLEGASLSDTHMEDLVLDKTRLEGSDLARAYLQGTAHVETHLEGANLKGVHLEGAVLNKAHLNDAILTNAHLEGARLFETDLEGANLGQAHLEGAVLETAKGLTQDQLDQAFGDEHTVLPDGLARPENEKWRRPGASPPD